MKIKFNFGSRFRTPQPEPRDPPRAAPPRVLAETKATRTARQKRIKVTLAGKQDEVR